MKLTNLLLAAIVGFFLTSCGGGAKTEEAATDEVAEEASMEEEAPKFSMETAVGVFHEVADVAAWTTAYEALSDPEGRITVLASNENPNMLVVFEWTESHAAAKEQFGSDRLNHVMDSIGVAPERSYVYYDVKWVNDSEDEPLSSVIAVSHEVVDYATWKAAYDADTENRKTAGLRDEAVSVDADNPNMVHMIFSTNDVDAVMAMMESDDLKQKMEEAGVKSEPNVSVWVQPNTGA
ncbi:MAG: hypothetical protein RJQ09_14430 [Cyclobacteriaceae bacterium]